MGAEFFIADLRTFAHRTNDDGGGNRLSAAKSTAPLITLGITCFNAASTIRRAVLSAKRQDWPNTEIIVVDDASTDDSREVLAKLAKRDPGIKIIRHAVNNGYPAALNRIVEQARGEFIAIFDDDDYSARKRLRLQWQRIVKYESQQHSQLVLCYSNRKVVKSGSHKLDHVVVAIGHQAPEPNGASVADYIFGTFCDRKLVWGMFGSCTLMARRETFLAVGPFDESFRRCAEWDFAVRAALMGAHFIAVNKPVVTQYKTQTLDKEGDIPLEYALKLRIKYKHHLARRHLYNASVAIAKSNYYGGRRKPVRRLVYMLLACAMSPRVLFGKLASKLAQLRN